MTENGENNNNSNNLCEVCKKPALRKCSSCKLVYYCTPEHQKEHWKEHKVVCKPYEICTSSELGRYLRATRDLQPGDVIFSESPILFGPKPHLIENDPFPCVGCCKLLDYQTATHCPNCLWPSCSRDCIGLNDPIKHGLECRILRLRPPVAATETSFFEYFRFDILIIIRALFMQKTNKEKWNYMLTLEDHMDKRGPGTLVFKRVEEQFNYLENNYLKPLKAYEKESGKIIFPVVNSDIIHKIYAILDVNATEHTEETDVEILYPTASLIEHNCTPNCLQIIADDKEKYKITFRAATRISKGEHITSIYTHILWGTHARRRHLLKTKYFECTCTRCKDPSELGSNISALKCMGSETDPCGGTQLPIEPLNIKTKWTCEKCKISLPNKDIMKFVNHLGGEVDKVLSKQPSVEDLEDILGKLLNFLHPDHYHIYAVKHSLIQLYGVVGLDGVEVSNNILNNKVKMCEDLISTTRKVDPGNSRLSMYLAVLLNELHLTRLHILKKNYTEDQKESYLDEIKNIQNIVDKGQTVLKYETISQAGLKLYEVISENRFKFSGWLDKNQIKLE